ncbi:MAG: hypothetical protein EB082_12425 [Verrucomicrobia bacterium]|nr:hypothetical protein [Verrucomicrobiota bacterium]
MLWQGRKIAGAAQRRNKQGLLIQGSVQPPPVGWERKQWEKEMAPSGHRQISLTAEVQAQAARLAVEKYSELAFYARR